MAKSSHTPKISLKSQLFQVTTTFLFPLFLSPPPHQKSYVALHETTYQTADLEQCTCLKDEPETDFFFENPETELKVCDQPSTSVNREAATAVYEGPLLHLV